MLARDPAQTISHTRLDESLNMHRGLWRDVAIVVAGEVAVVDCRESA